MRTTEHTAGSNKFANDERNPHMADGLAKFASRLWRGLAGTPTSHFGKPDEAGSLERFLEEMKVNNQRSPQGPSKSSSGDDTTRPGSQRQTRFRLQADSRTQEGHADVGNVRVLNSHPPAACRIALGSRGRRHREKLL